MIVDQFGNSVSSARSFNRGSTNYGFDRPWTPTALSDIGSLISPVDRGTMVSVSRVLVENWGPARAIARQIPMYAIGKAWKPSLDTGDDDIKTASEAAIREKFCPMVDLSGRDLTTNLYLIAHLLIRDGEAFYLLTERKGGWPAIQIIPSHRIGQRDNAETVESGPYRGLPIQDGVISNRNGTPVAYRFLADEVRLDKDISARSLHHVFDCDYPEAKRGYPAMSHGLNDGRDGLQAHEWERLNMLARSAHTLIEHNESGVPDDDPGNHFSSNETTNDGSGVKTGQIFGGTIKTVRAGSGYKLESVEHNTPGEIWESFQDRLEHKICAGVPWPTSFINSGHGRGGGTSERRDIMQARQTIEDIQCTIEREARRIVGYAFKKFVKLGLVTDTPDWWRWSFNKPPKLTVDDGRVSKATLEMWRAGLISDDDVLNDMGKDAAEYWREKFNRAADKELTFIEVQSTKKVALDPRYKGMFTPNDMGEPETNESDGNPAD